ncbi:MAG: PAS domain-containing hybrid sensor histidine kinase/response regulator [Xanthomonadales bacterium]|nr:PAS domain-containing hybrid sensor histidine kinase/response regulator [Xanthomonadales bacterium]
MSTALIVAAAAIWLGLLFAVAVAGERMARRGWQPGPWTYALALGVYCTSWTFYGTVTQALRSGWWLPPTFVGTMLLFVFGWRFLTRLVRQAHAQNSTTLADFVAARLGTSPVLAATVTGVVLLGTLPYLALQLKAVSTSFDLLAGPGSSLDDSALWVALAMAVFAIAFGTRRAAASDRHPGLLLAIAFESLFKLAALLAIGAFVVLGPGQNPLALAQAAALELPPALGGGDGFLALAVLGALAMFTLPHQFHVGVIECADAGHVRAARWRFPLFLALIALPVLPLAWAGALLVGDRVDSDLYVLALPMLAGQPLLALLAFLGGLSAATAMVVVATLALSLMLGNHWLTPLLGRGWARTGAGDLRQRVLVMRRFCVVAVLLMAWAYSRALAGSDALADIGAQSFSALGQLAPAVLLALYRPGTPAAAVIQGLLAGVAVWAYVLLVPQLAVASGAEPAWLVAGPLGMSWLSPGDLLGLGALEPLTRATLVGFAANLALVGLLGSRGAQPERPRGGMPAAELRRLAARFLDPRALVAALPAQDGPHGDADQATVQRVELALAGVIGAASARLLLDTLRRRGPAELESVAELVGETSQALRFNQQVLEAALQNMSQGISVVDRELRLVAWNRRYSDLFRYPEGLLQVGVAVERLLRHNLDAGMAGPGDIDGLLARRLGHMRAGTPYVSERTFPGGEVVEIRGTPMPGGGFVATFTDVSAFRRTEAQLKLAASTLEQRVAERTAESERARALAERASQDKTRFLAAVSHDLAQPLNAARLFSHGLAQKVADGPLAATVDHIAAALAAAEDLLGGLLDISRLESGRIEPTLQAVDLGQLLAHLAAEFGVLAQARGLTLRAVPTRAWVCSDPHMLRRVLQNFLANAIRYTRHGRIVLGCRHVGESLRIEVWDSGPGIAADHHELVFEAFRRLDRDGQGLGLGLAIAQGMAQLLGHPLALRSWPGRGSVFAVSVPRVAPQPQPAKPDACSVLADGAARVLVVDNDPAVLAAMTALLGDWGYRVQAATEGDTALRLARSERPDVLVLDYHLDGDRTGLGLRADLVDALGELPTIVVTADHDPATAAAVAAVGCHLLHKPVRPLALRSLLARVARA